MSWRYWYFEAFIHISTSGEVKSVFALEFRTTEQICRSIWPCSPKRRLSSSIHRGQSPDSPKVANNFHFSFVETHLEAGFVFFLFFVRHKCRQIGHRVNTGPGLFDEGRHMRGHCDAFLSVLLVRFLNFLLEELLHRFNLILFHCFGTRFGKLICSI